MSVKAVVTGGKGFIGSALVRELEANGFTVDTFDLSDGKDITDRQLVIEELSQYPFIFHLAGKLGTSELIDDAYDAARVNILGTLNVLDAARINRSKVVNITKPNVWLNTYSITKQASEDFAKMYYQEFGVPTVSIKWFNVYGPGQSFHCQKAVPYFIRWGLKNEDIQIWGDGEQTMDLIHTKDAVSATVKVALDKEHEGTTVEVGSGVETSVNELASRIIALSGSRSRVVHLPMRPGETNNTRLCANNIYDTTVDLNEGLLETIEWYRENL